MHRLDLNSIMNVTDVPCASHHGYGRRSQIIQNIKMPSVRGLSEDISRTDIDCVAFKDKCTQEGIR